MNNQEIVDNAPEGATHVSEDYGLLYLQADPDAYVSSYSNFRWNDNDVKTELLHFHTVRSLADIRRIAELEKERAVRDLEQQAKGLQDYVSKTMDNRYILHLDPENIQHCILINLNATALRLLERAKALKEQGE